MLEINSSIRINESELTFDFIRAAGPGGQNINKVATAAQLRFNVWANSSLPVDVKARLVKLAGKRITRPGVLIIEARRFRTQEQNRADAIERFVALVRKSLEAPKPRKKTRPTAGSREKRLQSKKKRSEVKRARGNKSFESE
ncbi:MAG: aminoacyl-tRNA hydrolase [Chloroflexi bacterium]|nr:aminoacyl-tRNA hydrolase [Chloroflexota bacterium]